MIQDNIFYIRMYTGGEDMNTTDRIRDVMKAKGMSQGRLADAAGVSRATINNYLTGATPLTLDRADQIAEILGVTLADLVVDDTDKQALEIGRRLRDADIPSLIRQIRRIIEPFME